MPNNPRAPVQGAVEGSLRGLEKASLSSRPNLARLALRCVQELSVLEVFLLWLLFMDIDIHLFPGIKSLENLGEARVLSQVPTAEHGQARVLTEPSSYQFASDLSE